MMYRSLAEPYFRYCCLVWGVKGITNLQKLQKLQNGAVRVVTNSPYDGHWEPLTKELGWPTIKELIDTDTVKIVCMALHNEASEYLKELLHRTSDIRSRVLRNSKTDVHVPHVEDFFRTEMFRLQGSTNLE